MGRVIWSTLTEREVAIWISEQARATGLGSMKRHKAQAQAPVQKHLEASTCREMSDHHEIKL